MFTPDWPIVTIITAPGGLWLSPWGPEVRRLTSPMRRRSALLACGKDPTVMRFLGQSVSFAGQQFHDLRSMDPGGRVSVRSGRIASHVC